MRIGRPVVERAAALVGSVIAVRTRAPEIVLTFDDGPDPVGTEQVMTALADRNATATFFVLGTRSRRHPSLLAEIVAAGHEIGLHGPDHQPLPRFDASATERRTADAAKELADLTGRELRWFRPPYGRQTLPNWRGIRAAGLMPVFWGPTTWDWRDLPQQERVAKAQQGARPGAILLGHDGFAGTLDGALEEVTHTLDRHDLIGQILDRYTAKGWRTVSLGHALEKGRPIIAARFSR
ncbi:peptidoglycan/xylan/chitin deacetylase (PgdA/CDA1 family) [Microlunatus parietis]|uniref:Peptidoglycan/xylan/chitin deacetylase (PgdA/CDA1 family) n=1 Tax=Microlunatus parietis TaxID=682979 RepID=A0A7Y9LDP1_9ACTN|nr:polysaccharide deacetylase family protein [Microlunatus parietis]NYE73005.1 peptidoglycan/xylan/chitin deacetylase (PgdA/CDA1 family) [Microlunatus parietis]